jgi:general secretion pathway protein D
VRGTEVSDMNDRAIDVGTANAIELRRVTAQAAPQPAGNPQQAPPPPRPLVNAPGTQAPSAQPQGGAQGQGPQASSGQAAAPGSTAFLFDPSNLNVASGSTFAVNILLSGAQNVYSVPLQLNYDPNRLELVNVSNGGFLSQDGQAVALVHRDDAGSGTVQITATRPPGSGGISGQGSVVTLTFMAKAAGQSALSITKGGARDSAMQPITVAGAQASVNVQ